MGNINGSCGSRTRGSRSRIMHHGADQRRSLNYVWLVLAIVSIAPASARAQQQFNLPVINSIKDVPVTDTLKDATAGTAAISDALAASSQPAGQPEEEEFIKPSRPSVANPAEIHKAGVLQIEYGYDANFHSRELHTEQSAPLALRFAATSRLLLELDLDTFKSETDDATRQRETGIGDARVGVQFVALKDTAAHPAIAFAYYLKLPTASEEKGLGTGRYDHKLIFLLSKKVGEVDLDFNAAYLNFGREDEAGRESGGQAAFSFSREFENNFGFEGELSGQSLDEAQPRGIYALTALTYKVNRRLQLDGGLRFGLTADAPRLGVFGGMTVGVADFFGKSR